MEESQKKIIEDKVIKMINFWNDIEKYKNDDEFFMTPKKKGILVKEKPKTANATVSPEKSLKSAQTKKLKPMNKSRRKKMIASDSKFFNGPLVVLEPKFKNTIINLNRSEIQPSNKNSASEKLFLFPGTKREQPLKQISFNEKMRKLKMMSDSKAYYHGAITNFTEKVFYKRNSNKPTANQSFGVDQRRLQSENQANKSNYGNTKGSLSPSVSMISNSFYKSSYNSKPLKEDLWSKLLQKIYFST